MSQSKPCPKCGSELIEGFIADTTHGGASVASWREGEPKKSFWVGLKLHGTEPLEIETWRCRRCGYLENYAPG